MKEKILITGISGFIGSHLANLLADDEFVPIGLTRPGSKGKRGIHPKIQLIESPTHDWPSIIMNVSPEILILCDWEGVGGLDRSNVDIQASNVARWVELIEAAVEASIPRIIALGSQAELSLDQKNIPSHAPLEPRGTYGRAKADIYEYLERRLKETATQFDWVRIFSAYGESADAKWLLPSVINSINKKQSIDLTECQQQWNFLHVEDISTAIRSIIRYGATNKAINVAHPQSILLREVIEFIGAEMKGLEYLKFGAIEYAQDQVMNMEPDVSVLKSMGWEPRIQLKQTLGNMIKDSYQIGVSDER